MFYFVKLFGFKQIYAAWSPSGLSVFLLKCIGQIADHLMRWRLSIFCKFPGYPLNFLFDFIRQSTNLFEEAKSYILFRHIFLFEADIFWAILPAGLLC